MILKGVEKLKKFREAQQQYATPSTERNTVPNNAEGSTGDTALVNQKGNKFLYIKGLNEWHKTELNKNVATTSVRQTTTAATGGSTIPDPPTGSVTAERTANQFIKLTWTYGSNTVRHEIFRSSNQGASFVNPGTELTSAAGTSSGNFTDNLTSLATGTWVYKVIFYNSIDNDFVQYVNETTISAYISRPLGSLEDDGGGGKLPYSQNELLECAEFSDTTSNSYIPTTYFTDDINFVVNSSKMYDNAQGAAVNLYGNNGDYNDSDNYADNHTNGWFSQDHPDGNVNDDVILNIDDDGDIIGKYSARPNAPGFSTSATTNTLTVSISGEAYVTRYWQVQIDKVNTFDSGDLATAYVTPSVKGTTGSANASGSNTFSSLSSSTTYYVRVRAQNGTNTGSPLRSSAYTNTQQQDTSTTGTWSNIPNDFTLTGSGHNGFQFSSLFQVTLSSGTGNTAITCSQSGLSGVLLCNISTSGDPGQNASSYGANKTITHSGSFTNQTYYVRFYYKRNKSINNNTTQDITFTNSTNVNTDLDITCVGTDVSQP